MTQYPCREISLWVAPAWIEGSAETPPAALSDGFSEVDATARLGLGD
jgi:hypothetical protein